MPPSCFLVRIAEQVCSLRPGGAPGDTQTSKQLNFSFQGADKKSQSAFCGPSQAERGNLFHEDAEGCSGSGWVLSVIRLWLPAVWPGAPRLYWVDLHPSERYAQKKKKKRYAQLLIPGAWEWDLLWK